MEMRIRNLLLYLCASGIGEPRAARLERLDKQVIIGDVAGWLLRGCALEPSRDRDGDSKDKSRAPRAACAERN